MTEEARHQLYEALKEAIGVGPTSTLMDGMPPVGWADVATKRDLDHLEDRLSDRLRAEWRKELADVQRSLFFQLIAVQATFAGLIVSLVVIFLR